MANGEKDEEMMVVVKRGASVAYREQGKPSLTYGDIYDGMGKKTWADVKKMCIDRDGL